jgi:LPS-assembly lipoprotein
VLARRIGAAAPDRRAVLALLLVLPACGLSPAYAPGGAGTDLLGRVSVTAPPTSLGYAMRTALQDRLGPPIAPGAMILTVTPEAQERALAVTAEGARTRINLLGQAAWRLTGADGILIAEGVENGFTAWSTTASTVAVAAAAADAEQRLAVILADLILARLAVLP